MRLTLAGLALAAFAAPSYAAPPELQCTRIGMYFPEFEEAYRSLPPEVHWAVNTACGWD